MELKRKNDTDSLYLEKCHAADGSEVPLLKYPLLEKTGMVEHCFSTRMGGVSEGIFSSMNLSFTRGDDREAVEMNFHRIAEAMGGSDPYDLCAESDRRGCGKGVTARTRLPGCGRNHYGRSGTCALCFFCGLCAFIFRRSRSSRNRAFTLRMEGNRKTHGRKNSTGVKRRVWNKTGGSDLRDRTINLCGLL